MNHRLLFSKKTQLNQMREMAWDSNIRNAVLFLIEVCGGWGATGVSWSGPQSMNRGRGYLPKNGPDRGRKPYHTNANYDPPK